MKKITGDVQEVLVDALAATLSVLIDMAVGTFGDIPEDTALAISSALGHALADVQRKVLDGHYSLET